MKQTLFFLVLVVLPALGQQSIPCDDKEFPLTERVSSTTCRMAANISCVGAECPVCVSVILGGRQHSVLVFPDNKKTSIDIGPSAVPSMFDSEGLESDGATPRIVNARLVWEQLSGGNGFWPGEGPCQGSCFTMTVATGFLTEGMRFANLVFGIPKATDPMSNQAKHTNPKFRNKFTGTARGLDRTGAQKRKPVLYRITRDATEGNPADTLEGNIGLSFVYISWPTVLPTSVGPFLEPVEAFEPN